MSYTKGPWEVEAEAGFGVFVHDPEGTVAEVMCDQKHTDDYTALANARLIAAAPELLEALRLIVTNSAPGSVNTLCRADLDRAKQAIRKAEGK